MDRLLPLLRPLHALSAWSALPLLLPGLLLPGLLLAQVPDGATPRPSDPPEEPTRERAEGTEDSTPEVTAERSDDAVPDPAADAEAEAEASPPRWPEKEIEVRLSLEDAVRLALANNLEIRIARVDKEVTYHLLGIERAIFDPFFTMGANYSKNRRPTASFLDIGGGALQPTVQANPTEFADWSVGFRGLTPLGTSYRIALEERSFDRPRATGTLFGINPQVTSNAVVTVTQPLLKGAWWRYNTASIRIAQNNRALSAEQFEETASDVVFRVEQAYWNLVFALKNYEAKAQALEVARQDLENARKRLEVGTVAAIDVTITESQLALRKVEFNDADTLLEDARDALLDLLNQSGQESLKTRWRSGETAEPYDRILVIPTTRPAPGPLVPDRGASLELAFDRRPDYRQVLLEIENQEVRTRLSRNELLPQLDIVGGWEQQGLAEKYGDSFSSLGSGDFYSWSIGVQLEIPILGRGPRHAYLSAQEELRRDHLTRAQLENRIVLEVDQSLRELRSLFRKVQDLQERVRLQEAVLEAERKKVQAGKSIDYTVSTIENDFIESQAQALRASADFQTAKARYHRVTGSLLEEHLIELEP